MDTLKLLPEKATSVKASRVSSLATKRGHTITTALGLFNEFHGVKVACFSKISTLADWRVSVVVA
jgi:hypothetical protein